MTRNAVTIIQDSGAIDAFLVMAHARRWAAMSRIHAIQVASLLVAFTGCSDRPERLGGYEQGKGDLGGFIVRSAPKLGVRLLTTNGLPPVPAKWHHRATRDELEVIVEGDCYPQLHRFLTRAVGPSQGQPRSSGSATNKALETYYGTNAGATVCCKSGIAEDGKEYTSFVIVGYGTSAMDQGKYAQLLREAADKANDSDKALDAARPSAPYVSDFVRLFPKAEMRHRSFTGGLGFDLNVDLYDRYEFTMQLPVVFDSSHSKVIGYGEPRFWLGEVASVARNKSGIAETTYNPAGERRFGATEWRKVAEAGGDFRAIGYMMQTNSPVLGFSDRKIAIEK